LGSLLPLGATANQEAPAFRRGVIHKTEKLLSKIVLLDDVDIPLLAACIIGHGNFQFPNLL
jgi:hypothetical protein